MTTQFKRIIPTYYRDARLNDLIKFGEQLFLSCSKDFKIYTDYENLIYHVMPSFTYKDYIEIMSTKLEIYQSKFADYTAFILENIKQDYGDSNTN